MKYKSLGVVCLFIGISTLSYTYYNSISMGHSLLPFISEHRDDYSGFFALCLSLVMLFFGFFALYKAVDSSFDGVEPIYPVDENDGKIIVPESILHELKGLTETGDKAGACQELTRLTGADLFASMEFIENINKSDIIEHV